MNAESQRRTANNEEPGGRHGFDLEERLLQCAASIIRLVDELPDSRTGNHLAGQLLRSGTSPLPNHGEAQSAESRKDFIHIFKVCLKELRESHRWLLLIKRVPLLSDSIIDPMLVETEQLIRIFQKSVRTAVRHGLEAVSSPR